MTATHTWASTEFLVPLALSPPCLDGHKGLGPGEGSCAFPAEVGEGRCPQLHRESLGLPVTCPRRLQQPEHKVLQQLRTHGDDVFVVTEVLQTQKEVEVTRTRRREGSGQFALPGAMSLQVCSLGRVQGRAVGQEGSVPRQTPVTAHD